METSSIQNIIEEALEKYQGGEKYFTYLDQKILQNKIIENLLSLVQENNIISSGRFGKYILNNIKHPNIFVVNGGLRLGDEVKPHSLNRKLIKDEAYTFVDDSFYSGNTRDSIKRFLERQKCNLAQTCVVYDGSKMYNPNVLSLYQYYKNKITG